MRAGTKADTPTSAKLGFGFFAIGLVFLAVTVMPFFFGAHNRSLWLNLGCLLAPLGFILAISATVRAGRDRQRAALAAVSRLGGQDPPGAAETAADTAPWHTGSSVLRSPEGNPAWLAPSRRTPDGKRVTPPNR